MHERTVSADCVAVRLKLKSFFLTPVNYVIIVNVNQNAVVVVSKVSSKWPYYGTFKNRCVDCHSLQTITQDYKKKMHFRHLLETVTSFLPRMTSAIRLILTREKDLFGSKNLNIRRSRHF